MDTFKELSLEQITARLKAAYVPTHRPQDTRACREAAVLMPLLHQANGWHLLYIRRSVSPHDPHSGQVAFAGGKYEQQDRDLVHTALREAEEEIGITQNDVTLLGKLNCHQSISRYTISPVVGYINWPYPLRLQPSEVSRAFTLPLHWLANPANHEIRELERNGQRHPVAYFHEYDGELLWGATARMTLSLLQTLQLNGNHTQPSQQSGSMAQYA